MEPIESLEREAQRIDAEISANERRQNIRLAIIAILIATAAAIYYF